MNDLVSIVIPTYNRFEELNQLIDSLLSINQYKNIEIIVVDNNSSDTRYANLLDKYRGISIPIKKIINLEVGTLSRSRNLGIKSSQGEYIFFIDDDNIIEKDTIERLIATLQNDKAIGIISPVAFYENNREVILDAGAKRNLLNSFTINLFLNENKDDLPSQAFYVSEISNAFMIKREVFLKIGLFDQVIFPIDLDEADLCLRAREAGFKIAIEPKTSIYHKVVKINSLAITSLRFRREKNAFYMGRNRILFQRRHLNMVGYFVYLLLYFPIFSLLYIFSSLLPQPEANFGQRLIYIIKFLEGIGKGLIYDSKELKYSHG